MGGAVTRRHNIGSNIEVAKSLVFSRKAEKIGGFITVRRL